MSTEPTIVDQVEDNLDDFAADFFGQKSAPSEPASPEKPEDNASPEPDAPKNDTQPDDAVDENDEDEDEVEVAADPEPEKPKKSRYQERIDELTAKQREAERRATELEARLAKFEQQNPEPPAPAPKAVEVIGPQPDDTLEDGAEKYPLGEFDPNYIRDLTKFTLQQEREAIRAQEAREAEQRQLDAQKSELQATWAEKLGPAKERYPDFQTKGEQLLGTFQDIDQAYGEYLSTTLMSMEFGPDVLYHLASNPDEARKIVMSGATKATIALGRLEAKFAAAEEEKKQARPKVSAAPPPPPVQNKGSDMAKASVPPDTDDLDAFAAEYFKSKKRRA